MRHEYKDHSLALGGNASQQEIAADLVLMYFERRLASAARIAVAASR